MLLTVRPGVRMLSRYRVRAGERWIYSAGFNVDSALRPTGRIDAELADLDRLTRAGARVAILSHQGSARDGTARHLDHVADYLARRLDRPVRYFPENSTDRAAARADALRDGEAAVFGNTRMCAAEERCDADLARRFARLGERVAVGGFAKAHRRHASNVGLLDLLPGYATDSLMREVELLGPWAGRPTGTFSVAALGGVKPEKVVVGLAQLSRTYDLVVPGGAVLTALLAANGLPVGCSVLGPEPDRCAAVARTVLDHPDRARIHMPSFLYVRGPNGSVMRLPAAGGVPAGHAIVDFDVADWALHDIRHASRVIVAGTPGDRRYGNHRAGAAMLRAREHARDTTLRLGGDTVADLPWDGPASTGGGAALRYLAEGTCAVLEALAENGIRFTDQPA